MISTNHININKIYRKLKNKFVCMTHSPITINNKWNFYPIIKNIDKLVMQHFKKIILKRAPLEKWLLTFNFYRTIFQVFLKSSGSFLMTFPESCAIFLKDNCWCWVCRAEMDTLTLEVRLDLLPASFPDRNKDLEDVWSRNSMILSKTDQLYWEDEILHRKKPDREA